MSIFARWTMRNAEMTKPRIQDPSGPFPSPFPLLQTPYFLPPQLTPGSLPLQAQQEGLKVVWNVDRCLVIPNLPHALPSSSLASSSAGISPVWMQGSGLSDQDEQVILDHLGSSIRASTRRTYSNYWVRFNTFCVQRNVNCVPASPAVIARFLIFIAKSNASVAGPKIAVSAICFYHKLFTGESASPTESVVVRNVMKSLSEKFAKPVKKAKGFTSLNLKDLFEFQFRSSRSIKEDESVLIMIAVMFCLMARHEEISKLTSDCVKILESDDVQVTFPSAKNYNFSDAKVSFIASCPNAQFNVAKIFADYVSSFLPCELLFPLSYNSALVKVRNIGTSVRRSSCRRSGVAVRAVDCWQ